MARPVPAVLLVALLAGSVVAAAAPAAATSGGTGDGSPCIDSVAFYTTYSPANPPPFRVGFSADGDDAVFFVLETRGRVVGHTALQTFSGAVAVDGLRVPLTSEVGGVRTVTVTAYRDANGNGAFDASADEPCTNEGEPVSSSLEFFVRNPDSGLTDARVTTNPAVAYQSATWTASATATRDLNVTRVSLDLRQAGSLANVTAGVVSLGYRPPANATFVTVGHPANVSVHRNGVLRATVPAGVPLENGSRLTVRVDGVRVPQDAVNVTLAASTPAAGYTATDRFDSKPVPFLGFYQSFPDPGVHLRFGLPGDVTMLVVVFHDGEVVGTEYLDYGMPMTADGKPVAVEGVSGRVELTVRGYIDANGNRQYDPDVDRPYVNHDGDPIGETAVINLAGTTTTTTGTTPSTGTTTSTGTTAPPETPTPGGGTASPTTPAPSPGFGALAGLVAVLATAALVARPRQ